MDAFLVWIELQTSAVLWTRILGTTELVDLSSFMDTFINSGVHRTAEVCSFMDTLQWGPKSVHKTA